MTGIKLGFITILSALWAGFCSPSRAQYMGTEGCDESLIATKLHFYYQSSIHEQVVAAEYRNTSGRQCAILTIRNENGLDVRQPAVTLKPGDVMHRSLRWNTEGSKGACQGVGTLPLWAFPLPNPLQVVSAQALVPQICSKLEVSDFAPGPFQPDWPATGAVTEPLPSPPVLTSVQDSYYDHETIELKLKLTDRPASDTNCPFLFEEDQDAHGNTILIQRNTPKAGCHHPQDSWRGPWTGPANEFPIQTGGNISWGVGGVGERKITFLQLAGSAADGELRLVRSNTVVLHIVPTPDLCSETELKPSLHFYNAPEHTRVVALDYTNTGQKPCLFPTHFVGGKQIEHPLITVRPSESIHSSVRWHTEPVKTGDRCRPASQRFFVAYSLPAPMDIFVSPVLLPEECSTPEQTDYLPGVFQPDWPASKPSHDSVATPSRSPAPRLTARKRSYNEHELVLMEVQLPDHTTADSPCPVMLLTVQGTGSTRSDQIDCQSRRFFWQGTWKGAADVVPVDVEPIGVAGFDKQGQRTVTVSRLADIASDGELQLIPSNTITIEVADPAAMKRSWGKTEQGVRVDLTMDKKHYSLGEDIPLHLALENVSSLVPVSAEASCPQSEGSGVVYVVKVEGRDGSLVPHFEQEDWTFSGPVCVGRRTVPLVQGAPVFSEKSLAEIGLLPQRSGTYKVSVFAATYVSSDPGGIQSPEPLVNVKSNSTTIFVDAPTPASAP